MLIRVRGKVKEFLYEGQQNILMLIETSQRLRVIIAGDKDHYTTDGVQIGDFVDCVCTLKAVDKEKGGLIYYNNMLFIKDYYNNLEVLGGEVNETRREEEIRSS